MCLQIERVGILGFCRRDGEPGGFQQMRFHITACCFAFLTSLLLSSAASELSYAQQIDAAYKIWVKSPPSAEIPRSGDPHVEAMQLRATLFMGQDVRQETKFKLLNRLAEIEKSSGGSSVKLVPILLQLAALPGLDDGLRNVQRAVSIANAAPLTPDKKSDNMAAAEWLYIAGSSDTFFVVAGGANSGSAILTDGVRESMLKASFKLGLKVAGLNSDVLDTLLSLCDTYRKQRHSDELIAIGRATLNALAASTDSEKTHSMKRKFLKNYQQNLMALRNTEELAYLDRLASDERKKDKVEFLHSTLEQLQDAEKRAEVDPYRLLNARVRYASALLSNGDKAKAFEQYRVALKSYRDMPVSNVDRDVTQTIWNGILYALRNVDTKADELIIYDLVEAHLEKYNREVKRRGLRKTEFTSYLNEVTRYYMDKHRNDSAIEFLSKTRDKVKKLCPSDYDTYNEVCEDLRQLYERFGDVDRASEVAQEQLDSLTQKDSTAAGHLLGVAAFYVRIDNFEKANSIINQVLAIMQSNPESFKAKRGLYRFQQVAQEYDRKSHPKEADIWIRKLVEIVKKNKFAFEKDLSWADNTVRVISKEYCRAGDFESAEALVLFAQSSFSNVFEEIDFSRDLAEVYTKHAASLKKEGKAGQAQKALAQSNDWFNRSLKTYSEESAARMIENRQNDLRKYGLIEQGTK